ncbi:hypothetical protein [Paenibacillus sp. Leaf72]|uniref:hypothetical protein n=1 Tax=Paenibacillus sp. Leaf72 TaxID=1736234 RepID=UPI0006F5702D|nr:hypothetical protein [Paenibacillus sp. Leaf72]KQN97040.1 hypothetical protein ASF12_23510 [Paenibacillus sp. Leaf72]
MLNEKEKYQLEHYALKEESDHLYIGDWVICSTTMSSHNTVKEIGIIREDFGADNKEPLNASFRLDAELNNLNTCSELLLQKSLIIELISGPNAGGYFVQENVKMVKLLEFNYEQICHRIAFGLASVEKSSLRKKTYRRFYQALVYEELIPSNPIFMYIGKVNNNTLVNDGKVQSIHNLIIQGTINLPAFLNNNGVFDTRHFKEIVTVAVRFLDNVIEYFSKNCQVVHLDQREMDLRVAGYEELLRKRLPEDRSIGTYSFIKNELLKVMEITALHASSYLAEEKGPFEKFEAETFLKSDFLLMNTLSDDPALSRRIRKVGIRNAKIFSFFWWRLEIPNDKGEVKETQLSCHHVDY